MAPAPPVIRPSLLGKAIVATACVCLAASGTMLAAAGGAVASPTTPAQSPTTATQLIASDPVALAAAFAAYAGIPVSDVGALRAGSLHTTYDHATGTYWATAGFLPSRTASSGAPVEISGRPGHRNFYQFKRRRLDDEARRW